eukprot:CAMPEP_0118929162 /NCGR_PEP_ID=MMETSP1169-20130426/6239_1 /TAXON_ID=36882 /ORGANISM="Pyramimonas obovata, Strain CCMP722" /LENGTH=324 /DNA_ID=CAMNT_0006871297 /DNA_START=112 /DNA_END=1083 /DNA_ORIENTATION=-
MLTEVDIPGKGRGLVAARDIRAGETILVESPILAYVVDETKRLICANCLRVLPNDGGQALPSTSCNACDGQSSFCSEGCYTAACNSGAHSPLLCRTLKALGGVMHTLSPEYRDLARFLAQAYCLKMDEHVASTPVNCSRYAAFMALTPAAPPPGCEEEQAAQILHPLICTAMGGNPGDILETVALLRKDTENTYGVMAPCSSMTTAEGGRQVRANAVYPLAARLNHSCMPNVARFDYVDQPGPDNLRIYMRALDHLPAGTELVQSYFPISTDHATRRERLRSIYGFECDCGRCAHEAQHEEDSEEEEEAPPPPLPKKAEPKLVE